MILVDSSIWIDYFNGVGSAQTDALDQRLGIDLVAVGDLMLVEVLQGFRRERDYREARKLLGSLPQCELLGREMALRSAENYRALRKRGVTVRKSIDVIIASYCIEHAIPLLYSDRDFDPFVTHLGLCAAA